MHTLHIFLVTYPQVSWRRQKRKTTTKTTKTVTHQLYWVAIYNTKSRFTSTASCVASLSLPYSTSDAAAELWSIKNKRHNLSHTEHIHMGYYSTAWSVFIAMKTSLYRCVWLTLWLDHRLNICTIIRSNKELNYRVECKIQSTVLRHLWKTQIVWLAPHECCSCCQLSPLREYCRVVPTPHHRLTPRDVSAGADQLTTTQQTSHGWQ